MRALKQQEEEEAGVFIVIAVLFALLLFFYCAIKLRWFARYASLLGLLCFLAFSCAEGVYRAWVMSPTVYGEQALYYSFYRLLLLSLLSRFLYSYSPATASSTTPSSVPPPPIITAIEETELSTKTFYFVLGLIGLLWGLEESLPHAAPSEPFVGLLLAFAFLAHRYRKTTWRSTCVSFASVLVLVAGVLMAKSALVPALDALAGFLHILRFILLGFVIKRGDFKLIWIPGSVATGIALCALLLFPSASQHEHADKERGILDCLGAAGLGALFSLGALLAAMSVMRTNSLLTLQATSCLTEVLVMCVLTPLAQLPVAFPVLLGLNIAGLVISLLSFYLVVRHDPFVTSPALANLFKFLEEEENKEEEDEEEKESLINKA